MSAATGRTDADDQEPVAGGAKPVLQADRVAQPEDLIIAELDDPVAARAVEMIVGGITVVMLERTAIGQAELAEQPGLDEQPERPIDGRAADLVPSVMEVADQLVGVEVLV